MLDSKKFDLLFPTEKPATEPRLQVLLAVLEKLDHEFRDIIKRCKAEPADSDESG